MLVVFSGKNREIIEALVSITPGVPSEKFHEKVVADTELEALNITGDAPHAASGVAVNEAEG